MHKLKLQLLTERVPTTIDTYTRKSVTSTWHASAMNNCVILYARHHMQSANFG